MAEEHVVNSLLPDSHDQDGWTDRIFQCLVQPSVPEEAAAAAAAAWLIAGGAESAVVILFESASRFVRATGRQDSPGNINISVDSGAHSIAALFDPHRLCDSSDTTNKPVCFVWPERLAACLVSPSSDSLKPFAAEIAARILESASTQQTRVPGAAHMEAMAEFAAGAGHEINNPLGSIIGQTQLLLKQEEQTGRRQSLSTIGSQAWRIRDMIGDCMLFARPPRPAPELCDLNALTRQAAENTTSALNLPADSSELELPETAVTAEVDTDQLRTLISHLVRNSLEACLNGEIQPRVRIRLQSEPTAVLLTVQDRGPGVTDEAIRRHLFDPFYSGRQAGRGIGFGLPVCWQIARNHGGLILHETPRGGGATFVTVLPKSPEVADRQ